MNEKILVVDDEEAILLGVGDLLASEGYRVVTARDGKEALERWAAERPDLVLLDVMMPAMSGYDVCRAIRRTDAVTPVMMLTAKAEEVDKVVGLELGADDYVVKPFSVRELILRVRAVLRRAGQQRSDKPVTEVGPVRIDLDAHRAWVRGEPLDLTPLEFKLLSTLVSRAGRVQSRERLLADVWEMSSELETRTVDTHVKRLREKLGPARDMLETVRGVGYRLLDPADGT